MTEEEAIERFLSLAKDQPTISLYDICKSILSTNDTSKIQRLYYTLQVYNIVEKTTNDDPYFMLSILGRQVIKEGGWVAHLDILRRIEVQKEADRQLAREVNESVKRTNLNQVVILWATFGVSVVSLVIAYLTYNKEDKVLISEPIRLSKLDTLNVQVTSDYQERINDSTLFSKKP